MPTTPTGPSTPTTVAEAYLQAMKARGVDYLFGNAGTDFAPVIEALATADERGLEVPEAVEIIHETLTTGLAYGYYLATGRPQAAMVHVNVGLANALMGLINAYRGQVPMLFTSGRTPITEAGRVGSRNVPIHWGQEMFDQGGMVREFTKWDNELRVGEQVADQIDRALAIAQAEPKGPTYLSLPREVLAETLPDGWSPPERPQAVPTAPHPDPAAVARAAEALAGAEQPLVLTSGADAELFDVLGPFAERFAVPVSQYWRTNCAIATTHPYYAGEVPKADLARSDVVVVLNSMVPWMPDRMSLRDGATVISIGADPLFTGIPVRGFPSDLTITSTPAAAVRALHAALDDLGATTAPTTESRRRDLPPELRTRRDRERAAGQEPGKPPMTPEYLSRVLGEALGPEAIVVNELGLAPGVMDFTRWDSYFGPPISGGLGWGIPTALGLALGHRDQATGRQIVAAIGDGSYVFANPAACHHAAASLGLGLLTVVADNRVWNAVRRSTIAVYPEGRAAASEAGDDGRPMPLSSLDPAPDYPKIVEAYGGHGEHVDDPDQLKDALNRALEVTATGRHALVSVHCSYPDIAHH